MRGGGKKKHKMEVAKRKGTKIFKWRWGCIPPAVWSAVIEGLADEGWLPSSCSLPPLKEKCILPLGAAD